MSDPQRLVEQWFALGLNPEEPMRAPLAGPSVMEVGARLSSVPREFLDPRLDLHALANDALALTPERTVPALETIVATGAPECVAAAAVALWLYASQEVVGPYTAPLLVPLDVSPVLLTVALRIAPLSPNNAWLTSEDIREEFVRSVLWWSGMIPAGESLAYARDMMRVHDSVARVGGFTRARRAYEHRLDLNRRLQAARAREAAQRYGNE